MPTNPLEKLPPIDYKLYIALEIEHDPDGATHPCGHPLSERDYTRLEKHLTGFEFSGAFGDIRIVSVVDLAEHDPKLQPYG